MALIGIALLGFLLLAIIGRHGMQRLIVGFIGLVTVSIAVLWVWTQIENHKKEIADILAAQQAEAKYAAQYVGVCGVPFWSGSVWTLPRNCREPAGDDVPKAQRVWEHFPMLMQGSQAQNIATLIDVQRRFEQNSEAGFGAAANATIAARAEWPCGVPVRRTVERGMAVVTLPLPGCRMPTLADLPTAREMWIGQGSPKPIMNGDDAHDLANLLQVQKDVEASEMGHNK